MRVLVALLSFILSIGLSFVASYNGDQLWSIKYLVFAVMFAVFLQGARES